MADQQAPWPNPPREPGPWAGGPPVAPPGNTALPPLPGAGGVVHNGGSANPWAANPPGAPQPGGPQPYGGSQSPPTGPPPQPFPGMAPPRGPLVDRASGLVLALSALVVLAMVAGGAYVVTKGGRSFPSKWDARVRPIADWVARDRKLSYDHPVEVAFLTSAEYTKASSGDNGGDSPEPDAAAKADSADQVAELRAPGVHLR